MKRCKYCDKEYIENKPEVIEMLPPNLRDRIKFIPSCNCLEERQKEEYKRLIEAQDKERKINRIKKYKDISIIDSKFNKSKFDRADLTANHMKFSKRYSERFIELGTAPAGILFTGAVGTGKTYASGCIANYLMDNNKTVLVMQLGLYINKLKSEWEEAEKDVLKHVETCDLLVIDDFGTEKITEFVLEKTFNLIDKRYRAEKPLIITTNLTSSQLRAKFGDRIADRIEEMTLERIVEGQSWRKGAKLKELAAFMA